MDAEYELLKTVGLASDCGHHLGVLFVAVAAVVAAARLKRSAGAWVAAVCLVLFGVIGLLMTALEMAEIAFDMMIYVYAATSALMILLHVGVLVGVGLVKPATPSGAGSGAARG